MISLWALLDSNQRASDYESRAGSLERNDLAPSPSSAPSLPVSRCRTLVRPVVTGLVTAGVALPSRATRDATVCP